MSGKLVDVEMKDVQHFVKGNMGNLVSRPKPPRLPQKGCFKSGKSPQQCRLKSEVQFNLFIVRIFLRGQQ